ncbi:protein-S-isoprenylcysteine O-methyltransferase Ste14 [Litoreibacter halocynthiae]|uniref:Protein-S-isoprenylcysteine O-methyltransferase Ste14 n=1 Tax=Litoreibacter halocynthiae TaxID=1242689 RepID=A0A4R7LMT6_9RHOB|nr:methyltransferase [Litoreibacter halocynthiae]TDT77328.1 protein-S-isoprenylcysteine O-methyltransferase Ste14 [Litoreibacter halocynthiae]
MKNFPDLPPIWLLLFMGVNWVAARFLPWRVDAPLLEVVSWGGIAIGLVLIAWSAVWFWLRKTTIEPHHTPQNLIVEGPYQLSRNPIYVGMAIILAAAVVGRGQVLCLILIPLFVMIINKRFIVPEEASLRAVFGAEAETYMQATRRWL